MSARKRVSRTRYVASSASEESIKLPADFGGIHYYTNDLNDLKAGRQKLAGELKKWADHKDHQPFGVKALVDR